MLISKFENEIFCPVQNVSPLQMTFTNNPGNGHHTIPFNSQISKLTFSLHFFTNFSSIMLILKPIEKQFRFKQSLIIELIDFHKSHGGTITITGVHPPARFGELIEKDGRVLSFEEKPQASVGLINGGFMVFNKTLLNYLTTNESCDFEFGPLEKLAKEGEVFVYKHSGSWECMDNDRDVTHLNTLWHGKKAFWKVW